MVKVNWQSIDIKEGNRAMKVFVPDMGDPVETKELIQAETEKTRDQLKRNQKETSKVNPQDRKEALAEWQRRRDYKKETCNKRIFGGITLGGK